MSVGSDTFIKFSGNKEDLEKIYKLAEDGDEGGFYYNVFETGIPDNNWKDEDYSKLKKLVGVNSLCDLSCSPSWDKDELVIRIWSDYETPIGCWRKIAKDFPNIKASGTVIRGDDMYQRQGRISINKGKCRYTKPENV